LLSKAPELLAHFLRALLELPGGLVIALITELKQSFSSRFSYRIAQKLTFKKEPEALKK